MSEEKVTALAEARPENEPRVSQEQAEQEFENWAAAMDIDIDTSKMDAEDMGAFEKGRSRIINAITGAHLVFNDDVLAVYTPWRPGTKHKDPLTFHERSGQSLLAMDGKKESKRMAQLYAAMGDMCKTHPSTFANMVGTDIKTCEAIFSFLAD